MKKALISLFSLFLLGACQSNSNEKESSIWVRGNCGMCEERIEETVKKVSGVSAADWDNGTGMLVVHYDSVKTNQETIEKACAKVGHGTRTFSVDSTVDAALPGCCRMETEKH